MTGAVRQDSAARDGANRALAADLAARDSHSYGQGQVRRRKP